MLKFIGAFIPPRNAIVTEIDLDELHLLGLVPMRLFPVLFENFRIRNIMNIKSLMTVAAFVLATAGLRAQFSVDSVVANAAGDPANAPAIVANAAVKHPKFLIRIVSATVAALPKQAADIVRALIKVDPDQADDIVRAAIHAQPRLAVRITDAALQVLPENLDAEIIRVAVSAAPDDLKDEVAESTGDNGGDTGGRGGGGNGGSTGQAAFPSQPINPDLVSPSS
jgi:hypothetical protein